jgi:hypothetical protein
LRREIKERNQVSKWEDGRHARKKQQENQEKQVHHDFDQRRDPRSAADDDERIFLFLRD